MYLNKFWNWNNNIIFSNVDGWSELSMTARVLRRDGFPRQTWRHNNLETQSSVNVLMMLVFVDSKLN